MHGELGYLLVNQRRRRRSPELNTRKRWKEKIKGPGENRFAGVCSLLGERERVARRGEARRGK